MASGIGPACLPSVCSRAATVAVLWLVAVSVCTAQPQPAPAPNVEKQVIQTSNEWFAALMAGDIEALDRLQTDDFLTVQEGPGVVGVVDKAQQMENLRKVGDNRPRFERTLAAVKVRQYGNVAILTGLATFRRPGPRQRAIVNQSVVTEVWVTDSGRWRLAHFQTARLPAKP